MRALIIQTARGDRIGAHAQVVADQVLDPVVRLAVLGRSVDSGALDELHGDLVLSLAWVQFCGGGAFAAAPSVGRGSSMTDTPVAAAGPNRCQCSCSRMRPSASAVGMLVQRPATTWRSLSSWQYARCSTPSASQLPTRVPRTTRPPANSAQTTSPSWW